MDTAGLVRTLRKAAETIGGIGETIAIISDAVADGIDKVVEVLEDIAGDVEKMEEGPVEDGTLTPEQMYQYVLDNAREDDRIPLSLPIAKDFLLSNLSTLSVTYEHTKARVEKEYL